MNIWIIVIIGLFAFILFFSGYTCGRIDQMKHYKDIINIERKNDHRSLER